MSVTNAVDPEACLQPDDLIPDGALSDSTHDVLEHDAIAAVVADLVRSVETPANVALFGPWGSGKSSLYGMIDARLAAPFPDFVWFRRGPRGNGPPTLREALRDRFKERNNGVAIVRYDAWKFGGHTLQRNFLTHVFEQLELRDRHMSRLHGTTETSRLRLGRFLLKNKASLLLAFILALASAAVWATLSAWAATRWGVGGSAEASDFKGELVGALPGSAVVFGAVIAGLLLSSQAMSSAVEKRTHSPLQDADQFYAAFKRLMSIVTRRRPLRTRVNRLVVFVDELDRCKPSEVVKTLTDLLTFLDHHQCVFVVAADREVLEEALEEAPQAKPIRENEPYYSTSGAFLDKVFQHQLSLPPTRTEALTAYAKTLADQRAGLWGDLRHDKATYEDVVYSLVPAHVRSPRRVKVLMNNFATNVRVIQSRGLNWQDRAVEIAVLTVLQTEFPAVVRDLLQQPRLLEALTGNRNEEMPLELARMVHTYSEEIADPETDEVDEPEGASPLLTGKRPQRDLAVNHARQRLIQQLGAYLGKIHAADIPLPTPDLIYLQNAGHAEGLSDADLARLLDVAADTQPETALAAFTDATPADKKAAVRYLATQTANTFGPSRANLVELACRIAETLDPDDARNVARFTASTLLDEARNGRWRTDATPGAIWLGLLDEQIAEPLMALSGTGELDRLASGGALRRLMPLMPHLGTRVAALFPYFGEAYAEHDQLMHDALRELPSSLATRLWDSQRDHVQRYYEGLPSIPAPSPPATRTRPVTTAAAVPEAAAAETEGEARYRDLLQVVCERRHDPISSVSKQIVMVGLDPKTDTALYNLVRQQRTSLMVEAVVMFPDQNDVVLALITHCPDVAHIGEWTGYLTPDQPGDPALALTAAARIVAALRASDTEEPKQLLRPFEVLVRWLSRDDAEEVATTVFEGLVECPPGTTVDPNGTRRALFYDSLSAISRRHPDVVNKSAYTLLAISHAMTNGQLSAAAIPQFIAEIGRLDSEDAATLDEKFGDLPLADADAAAIARLRVAARECAGRSALPAKAFVSTIEEGAQSAALTAEWLATKPALKEAQQVAKRFGVPAPALRTYAATRNIAERSKLWITLEKADYMDGHLEAVGEHGVNASVVDHMAARISESDLAAQGVATKRLVTADLSRDTGARKAAQTVMLALLQSGRAGAGPNAARIAISAGGAAPGAKPELRNAFDTYISAHPWKISNRDLRELDRLGLFVKRKTSPLAKLLGWLGG